MRSSLYRYCLTVNNHGVKVVIKREVQDMFVNNYNPYLMLCWDANMDIQVTLDYFSVITYMTDYVCKPESKTTEILKDVKKVIRGQI